GERTLLERAEELAQIGSWDWDVVTGAVEWSDNLFRIYGFEPGEIVPQDGAAIAARIHPDDIAKVRFATERARTSGVLEPLRFRIVTPDGEVRRLESTMAVVEEQEGRPRRMIGAIQDLTDRFRADRNVAAHLAVSETLAGWDALEDGVGSLVSMLGEALACVAGALWIPSGRMLVMRHFWSAPSFDSGALEERIRSLVVSTESGLADRVSRLREAASTTRLAEEGHPGLRDTFGELDLSGGVGIPIVHRQELLAVLSYYSRDDVLPTERLIRTLTGIGYELGVFFDRHRGQLAPTRLTPREVEVLQHVAQGMPVKAVAAELGVSPATVRTHLEHIYAKYEVSDRAGAVAKGMREGLIR
ncbi:MAG: putative sensor signal transduction histidine kinase, partial [Solirubrobacterales bacterium]|nr:putative sensor signal transduction histidine kinase [Solirubrobacterales bacterium]